MEEADDPQLHLVRRAGEERNELLATQLAEAQRELSNTQLHYELSSDAERRKSSSPTRGTSAKFGTLARCVR